PVDTDDAFNNSDVDTLGFKGAALLDMQFEISRDASLLSLHSRQLRHIAADKLDPVAHCLATLVDQVEFLLAQLANHSFAANQSAFFVLKNDDFQRMPRRHLVFNECLRDFNRTQRTNVAVEVSTFRHAVDV